MSRELVYITITHSMSGLQGKNYGPFTDVVAARQELTSSGWKEMLGGPRPYWYAQTSKDEGMNAEIKTIPINDPESFPLSMHEKEMTILTA